MNILLISSGFIIAFFIVLYYERKIRQIRRTEPKNKVHFYVARDSDGELWLYMCKPIRLKDEFCLHRKIGKTIISSEGFSNYGLNIDDYANLMWEDEPVEVFLNLED